MVAFGHTAIGTLVGITAYQAFGDNGLVSGLLATGTIGVVSHYITDFIPHGHFPMPGGYKKGILPILFFDFLFSLFLFLGLSYFMFGLDYKFLYILFGIGGAQLPDVIDGLIYTEIIPAKGLLKLEHKIHQDLHWHGKGSDFLILNGRDIWQVLVIIGSLLLLLFG